MVPVIGRDILVEFPDVKYGQFGHRFQRPAADADYRFHADRSHNCSDADSSLEWHVRHESSESSRINEGQNGSGGDVVFVEIEISINRSRNQQRVRKHDENQTGHGFLVQDFRETQLFSLEIVSGHAIDKNVVCTKVEDRPQPKSKVIHRLDVQDSALKRDC